MSPTIDTSLTPLLALLAVVIGIALYVWMSLALAAMFRKMGEESWKGWVPLLNQATVLGWGGFNPWLVLLLFVPFAGPLIVTVLLVIAAHRINPGFGYGHGMTVLAALLFVVWASILGFGPSPWRGARPSVAPATAQPSHGGSAFPAPVPPFPVGGSAPAAGFTPRGAAPGGPGIVAAPASPVGPAIPAWAPPVPPLPVANAPAAPVPDPDVAAWPSEVDDVSAVSPSPFPPSAAAPRPVAAQDPVADGLISYVPGRRSTAPVGSEPVTRLPVTSPIETRSGSAEGDTFPELSGEVSAVVGSPAAGSPLSARSSVSAQLRLQEIPDMPAVSTGPAPAVVEDDVDETVMVRRRRITWQLVPLVGSPIPLTADVVILGRRPARDVTFPQAQLVAVHDDARTVSKTHARIELRGERWLITDLGSTNGVLVRTIMGEEMEIEPGTELDAGERFFLGDEEFHLQHHD